MKKINSSWIFLAIVFLVMCVLNFLTPCTVQDDIDYRFMYGERPLRLVSSLSDVVVSQWHHWLLHSGRTVPHVLLQTFEGVLGKGVFNVFNSAIFALMLVFISKYTSGKVRWTWMSIALALFLLLCPITGETVMWFTGSFNYLWTIVFALAFLVMFQQTANRPLSGKAVGLGILSLFLAWTNEGTVIPVCFGLGIYFLANIKKVWHQAALPLMAGWVIGAVLLVFAPGVFVRVAKAGTADASLIGRCITVAVTMLQLRLFWIFTLLALIVWWKQKELFRNFVRKHYVLLVSVYSSILVYFIANCHYPRVRFATEVFALLALLALLERLMSERTIRNTAIAGASISVIFAIPWIYYSNVNYNNWKDIGKQLKTPGCLVVQTPDDHIPTFFDDYLMKHMDFCKPRVWYFGGTNNPLIAFYYHKPSTQYIPRSLYQDISAHPDKYLHFATVADCRLVAQRMDSTANVKGVRYSLRPAGKEEVPFYMRPLQHRINRYSATSDEARSFDFVEVNGKSYLVATLPIVPEMRERVKDIQIIN